MKFHRDSSEGVNIVRAHGSDGLQVNEVLLKPPCVIAAAMIIEQWVVGKLAGLSAVDFEAVLEMQPELILLGTGAGHAFPAPELIKAINEAGVGIEAMDTAAACRTYNVLAHEGRNVVLALPADCSS